MEMDERAMIAAHVWPMLLTVPASFCGGLFLGLLYFQAVRATADLIVRGARLLVAVALGLGRVAVLGAGFALALQAGGLAVIVTLVGILVGRALTIRHVRSQAV